MAETAPSVKVKGLCVFMKAQFQTYVAFSYLLQAVVC